MEVDASARPASQYRAAVWAVDVQGDSARPAACRSCGQVFEKGELRLCQWGNRTCSRWMCTTCLQGRLPPGAELRPHGRGDATSVDAARAQTAAREAPEGAGVLAGGGPPAQQQQPIQHPAWGDNELPVREWWARLPWDDLLTTGATTYVQIPDRLRGAVLQVRRKSLEILRHARERGGTSGSSLGIGPPPL